MPQVHVGTGHRTRDSAIVSAPSVGEIILHIERILVIIHQLEGLPATADRLPQRHGISDGTAPVTDLEKLAIPVVDGQWLLLGPFTRNIDHAGRDRRAARIQACEKFQNGRRCVGDLRPKACLDGIPALVGPVHHVTRLFGNGVHDAEAIFASDGALVQAVHAFLDRGMDGWVKYHTCSLQYRMAKFHCKGMFDAPLRRLFALRHCCLATCGLLRLA
mmetsp:Transcript_98071/g.277362  ORF Transcript_98071/g.277362 Transcript_98071/m.277362 type:complete len:217 (-) Transcript_98071:11-661(-)